MNEQSERAADLSRPGEIIDFVSLARVLWRRRVFIVSGFIILTVISTLVILLAPKRYRCEAFLQVGNLASKKTGMLIPFFKEGELLLNDLDHIRASMALDQTIGEKERGRFFRSHRKNEGMKKYFAPVANFTKIARLPQDEGSSVIGFQLTYTGETPEITKKFVKFFGKYISGSYLAIDLKEYVLRNFASHDRSVKECENQEIKYRGQLERLNKQRDKLEVLARRFYRLSNVTEQQVQKMTKVSVHYMSPNLQLKAVESMEMNINAAIEENNSKKEIGLFLLKYFSRAKQLLALKKNDGIGLLVGLENLKAELFTKKNTESPNALYAKNTMDIDLQRFHDIYFGIFQFVTGPTVSLENTLSARIFQMMLVLFFSMIFMISAALLLHWGNRNWKRVAG